MDIRFPSRNDKDQKRRELAQWIDEQRQAYKNGTLSQEQIEKLESVPGWTWDLDSDLNDDELEDDARSRPITGRGGRLRDESNDRT